MRSFAQIVTDAGDERLIRVLKVKPHQPRDWRLRDSIPAEHWKRLARAGVASLSELAEAAAAKAAQP